MSAGTTKTIVDARGARDVATILVVEMPGGAFAKFPLERGRKLLVGREHGVDIHLQDESVSRRHATVQGGDTVTVTDLGSHNGTRVYTSRLASNEPTPVSVGAMMQFGNVFAFTRQVTAARTTRLGGPVLANPTMVDLYEMADVLGPSTLSVLILGETGVGKDVYAEALHAASPRANKPFMRINCAALPEHLLEAELFGYERGAFTGAFTAKTGLFEEAHLGTVFLDEIGETAPAVQAKLLRVLEGGEMCRLGSVKPRRVDVRVLSATNLDLKAACATGVFRSDLYFRLNGISVLVPPLRERSEDLLPLAEHFLAGATLTRDAIAQLRAHDWPGNVRELRNVIERAKVLARGGPISREHVILDRVAKRPEAQATGSGGELRTEVKSLEKARILEALARTRGNQSEAARRLGMSRFTLMKRMTEFGIERPRKA